MKQAEALVAEIRAYCAAHEDPQQAAKYARYFREGYDAWGIMGKEDPLWNAKKEEWLERYRKTGLRGTLKLGELLFAGGKYEEGAIAVQFAARLRDQFDGKLFAGLGAWFAAGIGNWAHTDVLCGEVIAPLVEEGRIGLPDLAPWRTSRFPYQRRAVPVALLGLLKKPFEAPPLLEFLRPMMMDAERVVQQGLGWFLRETWKQQPAPVEAFLMEWKDTAPRLIFQYATEKMKPAERGRFRRAKAAKA